MLDNIMPSLPLSPLSLSMSSSSPSWLILQWSSPSSRWDHLVSKLILSRGPNGPFIPSLQWGRGDGHRHHHHQFRDHHRHYYHYHFLCNRERGKEPLSSSSIFDLFQEGGGGSSKLILWFNPLFLLNIPGRKVKGGW